MVILQQPSEGSEKNGGLHPPPTMYGAPTTAFGERPSRPQSTLPMKQPTTAQSKDIKLTEETNDITWKDLSVTFDRFLFFAFTILLIGLTFVFMMVLAIGGS